MDGGTAADNPPQAPLKTLAGPQGPFDGTNTGYIGKGWHENEPNREGENMVRKYR